MLAAFRRLGALFGLALLTAAPALAAPARAQFKVTGYVINAELDPTASKLTATARVTFTALDDLLTPTFELNNGLTVTSVTDASGQTLIAERLTPQNAVRFALNTAIPKGTSTTWTFAYAGVLHGADTSPVEGIKLAAVADPISILLYPGRWFPMSPAGLYTDRFTAEMHIRVPAGYTVVGSGPTGLAAATAASAKVVTAAAPARTGTNRSGALAIRDRTAKAKPAAVATQPQVAAIVPVATGEKQFDFNWTKPGFPGTIVAGKFAPPLRLNNFTIYAQEKRKPAVAEFAAIGSREFEFMSSNFGQPETPSIALVELPEDSVSASWAPGLVAIAGNRMVDKRSDRLLANTLAHQWFGSQISPNSLNDAWITNGMSRYAELLYVEDANGQTAFQTAISDVSAGALAYDTEPLSTLGRTDPFSPQFQSMTLEKGAMIFHMLRWELGDDNFVKMLKSLLTDYTDKSVRERDIQDAAEHASGTQLSAFFAEWVDGTGAPAFSDKYTVYRLGNNKGFRTTGAISEDLDLFRMPVELRIETDGKTEERRIEVTGTDSTYSVETFGRPRRITIDPQGWVLKSTPDLAVRVAVLRGQQLVAQGDLIGALTEYQKALDANKTSSLAAYRIGEIFFTQRNYQSAANSFRDALRGDGDPRWTEVWSHIHLGYVFDVTGQRERAQNEYRQAVQTNDNTQGAVNEARDRLAHPYAKEKNEGQ